MPVFRFYHPHELHEKKSVTLDVAEGRHFATTLRGQIGDPIELFDGKGSLAQATVESVTKKDVTARISTVDTHKFPEKKKVLIQAILRSAKLDWIVEKATELGIDSFHLFAADKSEKTFLKESQINRLHAILIAACKQSGRLFLPTIEVHTSLAKAPYANAGYGSFANDAMQLHTSTFINGPEAGFSSKELKLLKSCIPTTLSQNILRTETAAIAASTLIGLL